MAEFLHFSRDTRVYIEKDNALWYIPVLDGFSFSQATNTSEITLSEMEDAFGRSRRGMKMFTDSLSAAEWSFSTYMRPFIAAGSTTAKRGRADDANDIHHAVEEALWGMMAGRPDYDPGAFDWEHDATLGGAISATPSTDVNDVSSGSISASMQGEYELVINSNLSTLVAPDGVSKVTSTLDNDYIWVDNGVTPTDGQASGYDAQNSTADQGMRNAVVKFTLGSAGEVSGVTVTERGTRFFSGDKLLIRQAAWNALAAAIGGSPTAPDIPLEFTFDTVESFTQTAGTRAAGGNTTVNFYDSNRAGLNTCTIYFFMNKGKEGGRLLYALEQAVVNEATIDFDVEGIATINWSGFAGQIKEMTVGGDTTLKIEGTNRDTNLQVDDTFDGTNSEPTNKSDGNPLTTGDLVIASSQDDSLYIYDGSGLAKAIDEGTTDTGNFIRNRLTQLTIAPTASFIAANPGEFQTSYSIPLTGGSITITNNINYLTPEELGLVNQPIEHVTGTRSCTGSMTCYLGASNVAEDRSKDLFNDLVNDTNSVINEFDLTFSVGGTDEAFPVVQFNIPLAHISVPTHSIEDVISLEATFAAQGTAIGEADEFNVVFLGT